MTFQDYVIQALNDIMVSSPFKVCHHPTKFGGYTHCGSEGVIVLFCHVIWQDHMIKKPCGFMVLEPVMWRYHPVNFGGHRHSGSEDIMIFVRHVNL